MSMTQYTEGGIQRYVCYEISKRFGIYTFLPASVQVCIEDLRGWTDRCYRVLERAYAIRTRIFNGTDVSSTSGLTQDTVDRPINMDSGEFMYKTIKRRQDKILDRIKKIVEMPKGPYRKHHVSMELRKLLKVTVSWLRVLIDPYASVIP